MSPVYITCKVLPGLFDTEYYVMVNGSAAYYVSRHHVTVKKQPQGKTSVDGKVRGYLIQKKRDESLVQLPGEVAVGGLRTWVKSEDVVRA